MEFVLFYFILFSVYARAVAFIGNRWLLLCRPGHSGLACCCANISGFTGVLKSVKGRSINIEFCGWLDYSHVLFMQKRAAYGC